MSQIIESYAAGRVNVIGEHTDYTGGLALPMAIDRGTTVRVSLGGDAVRLFSDAEPREAVVPLDVTDPSSVEPGWARYVAGMVAELRPASGMVGHVSSTLPVGAGLSSSASLLVALAGAFGFDGSADVLAGLCQRAEQRAVGVPSGVLDPLAVASGAEGCLVLLDCRSLATQTIKLPEGVSIIGVDSTERRSLATSEYGQRHADCLAAERDIGSLREATLDDLRAIPDPRVRRRARHVITENRRVLEFVEALRTERFGEAGVLLGESHASLRDDFDVTTPRVDQLVDELNALPGVLGARMTGAGFGGCVIALCSDDDRGLRPEWKVRASAGIRVTRREHDSS
jgi:galactokinase